MRAGQDKTRRQSMLEELNGRRREDKRQQKKRRNTEKTEKAHDHLHYTHLTSTDLQQSTGLFTLFHKHRLDFSTSRHPPTTAPLSTVDTPEIGDSSTPRGTLFFSSLLKEKWLSDGPAGLRPRHRRGKQTWACRRHQRQEQDEKVTTTTPATMLSSRHRKGTPTKTARRRATVAARGRGDYRPAAGRSV